MTTRRDIPALGLHQQHPERDVFTWGIFEEIIRDSPRRTDVHRHDFHELFLFESGNGRVIRDFTEHPVAGPAAVVMPAGSVHRWPDANSLRGVVLAFDLAFLGLADGPAGLLRPPVATVVPLGADWFARHEEILARLRHEWHHDEPARADVMRACLTLLLAGVLRCRGETTATTAAARLAADFLALLEANWQHQWTPKDYAAGLRVTPDHLAAALRETSGGNTSELIAGRVLLEAKRLLTHSRLGIAETAYQLGFQDASYFGRWFRKRTGRTPKEFRAE